METNTTPSSSNHQKNILMAILAYLGPLIIVSYVTAKDDSFVKYHIKQGLILLIGSIITWALSSSLWQFWAIIQVINLAILVLAIIGIINAAKGEEKELPIVGHFASNFKF